MNISVLYFCLLSSLLATVYSLGDSNPNFEFEDQDSEIFDIPSESEQIVDQRTTEEIPDRTDEQTEPTPPSVIIAAPLDPLPEMTGSARPPGFRPPTSFKQSRTGGEDEVKVNVGFVVRRGRAKVMGFSRRKTESIPTNE